MSDELYKTLGVDRKATKDEIRKAYRRRARKAHPDAGGNPEDWHRLQRALVVLRDDRARQKYDRTGDEEGGGPDLGPVIIRQMVMMAVEHVISVATQKRINPETVDIIADASRFMREKITEENRKIETKRKEAAAIRKMARRFKAKPGKVNVIGTMFDARAGDMDRDCDTMREGIVQLSAALKMIADHTFDWAPEGYSSGNPMTRSLPSWFEDALR